MKLPLSWLRDWVEWPSAWDAAELARRLTFAGFEVEGSASAAPAFEGVVVAKVVSVEPHPRADKLRVCRVSIDPTSALQIVCGAPNARAGMKSALATVGATLPGGTQIRAASLRGVESAGMLCSARELGLSDASEGILELPDDAPVGMELRRYLQLDDVVLDVNVSPNRGDAMSILGLARELAALAGATLKNPIAASAAPAPAAAVRAPIALTLEPGGGAARMAGCILRAAENTRPTPLWMRERLRRCGLRSISAVVDVTNYVMLELGQPIHAYDLTKLQGGLNARRARIGERLKLLDGRELTLDEATLVIADEQKAVGLAGIMGGADTAIERGSRHIALEVGWFKPAAVAATARRLSISTDASQRFERGVDWAGQERALERARQLIGELTGATAEPAAVVQLVHELPQVPSIALRPKPLQRLLGCDVPPEQVEERLRRLGMTVLRQASGWEVTAPSWRFDIGIEADLIEEVGRLGGLDAIPATDALLPMLPRALDSNTVREEVVMRTLAARGYYEAVNYAFVDPALQTQLFPEQPAIELANPLASDRAVMRVSLWPGLIGAARENLRRQADRIRLFEIAARFLPTSDGAATRYREQQMLAGLALGARLPEQWGEKSRAIDFYDVKEDLLCALRLRTGRGELTFSPAQLSCLHPGRSARISRDNEELGVIGELHPGLVQALDLTSAPILFELDYARAFHGRSPQFQEISRFPQIRRDLSLTLPKAVTFASVAERVTVAAPSSLKELRLFDIYQGEGVDSDRKSIAIGLILQDLSRTLTDEDADRVVAAVLGELQTTLDAKLRQ